MKKAIKALTEEDVNKICKKIHNKYDCCHTKCPLFNLPEYDFTCYESIQEFKKEAQLLERKVDIKD